MRRIPVCLGWLLAAVCALAQGPLATEPHLSLVFPFAARTEGVGVQHAVAISATAVIPKNAILRVIYVPPRMDDAEVKQEIRREQQEVAYTRINRLENTAKLTPQQAAIEKITKETVWPTVTMFQLALANLNSQDLHLVYLNPENMKLIDEPIALPFGLLLAEVEGKISVLAVEKSSAAETAGIKSGDVILSMGGSPAPGNLSLFMDALRQAKKSAESATERVIALAVKGPNDSSQRAVSIKLPMSLNNSLLDSPLDDVKDEKSKPNVPNYNSLNYN
jgi:membrane-associated protease RseP (regulator of RpoE activity)